MTICPILSVGWIATGQKTLPSPHDGRVIPVFLDCVGEKCEMWDDYHETCGLKANTVVRVNER